MLVTGATGLLGSSLVPALRAAGLAVTTVGRSGQVDHPVDLTVWGDTQTLLNSQQPDCIINLAALTDVDACERNPQQAFMQNVRIVENLVTWMQGSPETRLIHISTDQVYDGPGYHKEADVCLTNLYGFSKFCSEQTAQRVNSTIIRTNFFGRSLCPARSSISDWLLESLRSGADLRLFTDVRFNPLSLPTLCAVLVQMSRNPQPGVFNVGSREGMSKCEFGFSLAETFGLSTKQVSRVSVQEANLRARRPTGMLMDCAHFQSVFEIQLPRLSEQIESLRGDYNDML